MAALDGGAKRVGEIPCPDGYEYELDSDFEDEDEDPMEPDAHFKLDPDILEGQQSECSAEESESSLSSFELEGASDPCLIDNQVEEIIKRPVGRSTEATLDHEQTILVKFAAYRTWHAFLWYCYTDRLEFNKLKSQVEPGVRHPRSALDQAGPPTCSPKSMYRLADLVDDKELKAEALAAVGERMTEANVVNETFSVFTSKYPDIQRVELGALKKHQKSPKVKEAFLQAMEKYGNMPHAKPVLSAFYDNLMASLCYCY